MPVLAGDEQLVSIQILYEASRQALAQLGYNEQEAELIAEVHDSTLPHGRVLIGNIEDKRAR